MEKTLLDEVSKAIADALAELDGVVALRADHYGAVPHLFKPGDDLADLAIAPKYPLASVVDMLLDAYPKARLGVVARGCDERALIELAKREQVDLERVRVIGIACTSEEARECRCARPYPQELAIGERTEGVVDELIKEHLALSLEERLDFWHRQFSKCFKCYGCREVCPECFCEECPLEDNLWVEIGVVPPPFPIFHLIRAIHTVGRCVGCNECEKSCPAQIPLTILYSLLRRDVEELFGYEAGRSVDDKPPLVIA
jgi:ferredoxin